MPSRWNGKVGKINAWSKKLQSKSTSFIPPKSKEPHPDTCDFEDGRDNIPDIYNLRRGESRTFEPNEQYNFKSAYKRYLKALELRPSKILEEENKTTYFYYSCNANSGFWEVTVSDSADGTFINPINPLTIVCPPDSGYDLTGLIESDGTAFNWEQRAGSRTVLFSDSTILNPTIFIQSSCFTSGCDSGTGLPIILRVSLANNPIIFQDLIIYNTLTSTNFGNAVSEGIVGDRVCQRVTFIPAPAFPQKAYCGDEGTPILVTWNPPSCDSEFVIGYSLVANTTGSYIEEDFVSVEEERFFYLSFNKHYKIITILNIYGKIVRTPSEIIYLSTGGIQHYLFGDDTYNGLSSSKLTSTFGKVDLKVTTYEYTDIYDGIAASKLDSAYAKVDLKVTTFEYLDDYTSGIAASKMTSSFGKVNLGGVVIG